ncbi:TPA: accessory Sec system glycosyltransferase GtfA [Staphylococcus aureus]|nr:accessory Sec system glycosyltransferase GtfA [Staphylococcus aureus]
MTIYNLNFGIGWASSGVEYAQLYRRNILNNLNEDFKFIFLDFINKENIQSLTSNLGIANEEVIWIYQYFTDIKIKPTTYTIENIIKKIESNDIKVKVINPKVKRIYFNNKTSYVNCYLNYKNENIVDRAEFVSSGKLIRKEFYTYTKVFTEYYAPYNKKAKLYLRKFFNENGSVAYEEIVKEDDNMYVFPNKILYSKKELIGYFISQLNLKNNDILLVDRSKDIGQVILENKKEGHIGVVIHAEHYNHSSTNDQYVLWNNNYEYMFNNAQHIDFFIVATEDQRDVLQLQFEKYKNLKPKIYTIPVGNIKHLKFEQQRKPFSMITASRLANEKHVDWLIKAVIKAHEINEDIKFDIYGEGAEKKKLQQIIDDSQANSYINLKGHVDLTEIYKSYELYISCSTSEGFGLTLMEAVGSGLGIIGLDVYYGNTTFIKNNVNGYRIPINKTNLAKDTLITELTDKILLFFMQDNEETRTESYKIAKNYLIENIKRKWENLINEVLND